jgi:AraC-like DNA-binding protein
LACLAIERLRESKVPTDTILRQVGLTRTQTSDHEGRIPFHKHAALLEAAARETRCPLFGLRLSQSVNAKDFGLLGYIALNSTTLGDALRNMQRYSRVYSDGSDLTLVQEGTRVAIVERVLDPKAFGLSQAVELGLSGTQHVMSPLIGFEIRVVAIEFAHECLGPTSAYRRILKPPVRFNASRNAVIVKANLLDAPVRAADNQLLKYLKRHAQDVLCQRSGSGDIRHQVQTLIASRLQSGEPTIDTLACELGMSSRTLAGRLSEHGVTYRELLNDLRHQLALRYPKDGWRRNSQITYLLGFSEISAFNHAFKRWTGSTPSNIRAAR